MTRRAGSRAPGAGAAGRGLLLAVPLLAALAPWGARGQELGLPLPRVIMAESSPVSRPYRKSYAFDKDKDWFSLNIPIWQRVLSRYKDRPGVQYLEIGLYEGRSAVWMLENILTHPTSRLTGVDIFGGIVKQRFLDNVKLAGGADRTTLLIGYSQVELRKLPLETYDIIYIDGSHLPWDVIEDAVLASRLLKIGGLLIFDDYRLDRNPDVPRGEYPLPAVNAFAALNADSFEILHCDYQAILRRRS